MLILILLTLFMLVFSLIRYKSLNNPCVIFNLIWLVVFMLNWINLLDYYPLSSAGLAVLYLQMIGFTIGCFIADGTPTLRIVMVSNERTDKYELRKWFVYTMCLITIVVLFSETMIQISSLLKGMSLYDIKKENLIHENENYGIMVPIKIFIVFPTAYSISAITASNFLLRKKKNFFLIVMNLMIILLYSLQHGARKVVLNVICSFYFALMYSKRYHLLKRKYKRLIALCVILEFVLIVWLTDSRGIKSGSLFRHVYGYLSYTVPIMDQWLVQVRAEQIFTWGITCLRGFILPFFILFRGLGFIPDFPYLLKLSNEMIGRTDGIVQIGPQIASNAFSGVSLPFYIDGGFLFVLIGLLGYGYFATNVYKKANMVKAPPRDVALCFFIMTTIVMSFMRYDLTYYEHAMALLMILFAFRREIK